MSEEAAGGGREERNTLWQPGWRIKGFTSCTDVIMSSLLWLLVPYRLYKHRKS